MSTGQQAVPAWRRALHLAIHEAAEPPVGSVNDIEENRYDRDGTYACRECGDRGAAVTITTSSVPDPEHEPPAGHRQRYVWCQAVYPGELADLFDAIENDTLTLTWTRHYI